MLGGYAVQELSAPAGTVVQSTPPAGSVPFLAPGGYAAQLILSSGSSGSASVSAPPSSAPPPPPASVSSTPSPQPSPLAADSLRSLVGLINW